jgi:hypothetical protein
VVLLREVRKGGWEEVWSAAAEMELEEGLWMKASERWLGAGWRLEVPALRLEAEALKVLSGWELREKVWRVCEAEGSEEMTMVRRLKCEGLRVGRGRRRPLEALWMWKRCVLRLRSMCEG